MCSKIWILFLVLLTLVQGASAFEIKTPNTRGDFSAIEQHNRQELARGFSFEYDVDPDRLDDEQLRAHLQSLPLTAKDGERVRSFVIDQRSKMAIGTSLQDAELSAAHSGKTADGIEVVLSARTHGSFEILTPDVLGVFALDGTPYSFDLIPFGKAAHQRAYIVLLLDVSGSMNGRPLEQLKAATQTFVHGLSEIGPNVLCQIISFSDTYTVHGSGFVRCAKAVAIIESLTAGGGTNVQRALLAGFDRLRGLDALASILMVTDGRAPIDADSLVERKTAPVSALWLGSHWFQKWKFSSVVDTNLYGAGDIDGLLTDFFSAFQNAVGHQYVVQVSKEPGRTPHLSASKTEEAVR